MLSEYVNAEAMIRWGRVALAVVLAALVFIFDLSMPPGVGIGVTYMALVLLGVWTDDRRVVFVLAGAASALIWLGFYFPQGDGLPMAIIADRALALIAVWVTALVIFERRGVQISLAENERRIHGIMDNAADGMVTFSEAGLIKSINKSGEMMFGYTAGEVIGQNLSLLVTGDGDTSPQPPLEFGEKNPAGAGPREATGRRKDGSAFPLELVVGTMTRDGERIFISTLRDITERKTLEREAAEKRELLELVFENMAQGMAVFDENQRLVAFNKKAEAYGGKPSGYLRLGMSREDIIRQRVAFGYIEADNANDHIEGPANGEPLRREFARSDGRAYLYERTPLPNGGMIASYADITELKQAEAEAAAKSVLMETTIDTMAQGIAVYDGDERLVSFNGQFERIFGFPRDFLRLGMTLEELVRYRAENGQLGPGDTEELFQEKLTRIRKGKEKTGERRLPGGNSYMYHRKPLPDGGFVITLTDLTGQKEAERKIAAQAALLEATFQNMSQGVAVFDGDWKLAAFNPQFAEIMDYPPDLLKIGMRREDLIRFRAERGDLGDGDVESLVKAALAGPPDVHSSERTLANGRTYHHERTPMPGGGFISTATDITERKRAQEELSAKSTLLEATINTMAQGVIVYSPDERLMSFNRQYENLMGFPPGFLHRGMSLEEVLLYHAESGQLGPGDPKALCQKMLNRFRTGNEKIGERTLADGTSYMYHRTILPNGGFVTTFTDLAGQKKAEKKILEQAALLDATFQNMSQGVAVFDRDLKLVAFNPQFAEILNLPPDFLKLGIRREDIIQYRRQRGDFEGSDQPTEVRSPSQFARTHRSVERTNADGRTRIYERTPMPDGGYFATVTDITEQKRAREELAAQSQLLQATFENMNQGIAVYDARGKVMAFNEHYAKILNLPPDFLYVGLDHRDLIRYRAKHGHYGETGGDAEAIIAKKFSNAHKPVSGERTLPNGATYFYQRATLPDGGFISTVADISEWREAENKLHQAQKMEAVGQLTGGIAHDFNNLLAVSLGNLELAEEALEQGGDVRPFLETAIKASERGASLTSQLMAFSRRQALSPEATDVRTVTEELTGFSRRVLSETIDLKIESGADVWPVFVDRGQLSSALLNLIVNARDAMPDGGRITVSSANVTVSSDDAVCGEGVTPGNYVEISVADTGCGMAPEIREHVFEPFFTTKGVGQGSGLGLSMIYGFAQQSGGHVAVESEPGRGTTVRILIPRHEGDMGKLDDTQDIPAAGREALQGVRGKILVLEDDDDVRASTSAMLTSAGYDVVAASNGPKALTVMAGEEGSKIDTVLCDIVLGGPMNGVEVAELLKNRNPDLKIVFMTGYADLNATMNADFLQGWGLLRKPFTKGALIKSIEDARATKAA